MLYSEVQAIAKATIEYAKSIIKPDVSLIDLRKICEDKMLSLGADSFWYWDVGAFIFSGDETTLSISGREYITSDKLIKENDIITIDLSPQYKNIWGDFARTIVIENGIVVNNIENIQNIEWKNGLKFENILHNEMKMYANINTSFEELYYHINEFITENGYVNLDFLGNLGHSIVKDKNDRIYIEKGNTAKLGDVDYFTFEPHIAIAGSDYGYKMENIYYFKDGIITEL